MLNKLGDNTTGGVLCAVTMADEVGCDTRAGVAKVSFT